MFIYRRAAAAACTEEEIHTEETAEQTEEMLNSSWQVIYIYILQCLLRDFDSNSLNK